MKAVRRKAFSLVDLARLNFLGHARVSNHHILVACMPKSGSTYLSTIIGNLPSFSSVSLVPDYDRREQELDYLSLIYWNRLNYVAQHHVRWSSTLSRQIDEFSLRPVVLVRDIFDAVISLRDHYRRESPVAPMAWANQEIANWNDERLELFLASMAVPWYLSFYVGWLDSTNRYVVSYADLLSSPEEVLTDILAHSNIPVSPEDIVSAIDAASLQNTRRNIGVQGRGSKLSGKARDKIYELASFYAEFDLSLIGIDF